MGTDLKEIKEARQFDEAEMTLPEFRKYLEDKYVRTIAGGIFTLNYAHSIANQGHMPKHYGGFILRVRKVRGKKTVKITSDRYKFYERDKEYDTPPGAVNKK